MSLRGSARYAAATPRIASGGACSTCAQLTGATWRAELLLHAERIASADTTLFEAVESIGE